MSSSNRARSANGRFKRKGPSPFRADPATNPLNRVVFAQFLLIHLQNRTPERLAELATVCSTWRDTIAHYGEAIFDAWRRSKTKLEFRRCFFRVCTRRIGVDLNFMPQMLAVGATTTTLKLPNIRHRHEQLPREDLDSDDSDFYDEYGDYYDEDRLNFGSCPVLVACCYRGFANEVRTLLAAGAKTACVSRNGHDALMTASARGHLDIVNALVEARAETNPKIKSWRIKRTNLQGVRYTAYTIRISARPALMHAVLSRNADVVRAVVAAGANLDALDTDFDGSRATSLMIAAEEEMVEIVNILAAAGANLEFVNIWGDTALWIAVKYNRAASVAALVAAGADVERMNADGQTPLDYAVKRGFSQCVEHLSQKKQSGTRRSREDSS